MDSWATVTAARASFHCIGIRTGSKIYQPRSQARVSVERAGSMHVQGQEVRKNYIGIVCDRTEEQRAIRLGLAFDPFDGRLRSWIDGCVVQPSRQDRMGLPRGAPGAYRNAKRDIRASLTRCIGALPITRFLFQLSSNRPKP